MVTIVSSYNVTPNEPTPNDPLWLSDSDQIEHLLHIPTMYIYKAKHSYTAERLRNSLSKLLVYYYPVAGRLSLTKSGRMEVNCNAKGVTFLEAETTKTFGGYQDFSPSESTEELVPKVYYTQPIEEIPVLLVQLTTFHDGEGLVIGIQFSHPLTDASGSIDFVNRWAKLTRREELDPNEIPFLDRTPLKISHQPSAAASSVKLPEWKPAPQATCTEKKKRSAALLKVTSSQMEKLKNKANDQSSKELGSRPYSRFEVVAAHIWRCAAKTRESGENHPTVVQFSVNFRNRLNPPLPPNYFGNALAKAVTPKCYEGDIISNPLGFAAQKIRKAAHGVTDEFIRSQLSVILGQEQLDHIKAFFMGQGQLLNVPYAGDHNILLTSWMNMPLYDADFGWGKPVLVGLASRCQEDRAAIFPSPDGDGVVVTIFFQEALMQLFKKFFYV